MSHTAVVTDPEVIRYLQFCSRLLAAELEVKGLRHSSRRSFHAYLKRAHNLRGNRASVLAQLKVIKEQWAFRLDCRLLSDADLVAAANAELNVGRWAVMMEIAGERGLI